MTLPVSLRTSSAFSFLSAASLPEDLARIAGDLGLEAVALADADGVYGVPRFVKAAREAGVRPIVGASVRVDFGPDAGGTPAAGDESCGRLVLLCEDLAGWQNLCELLTEAHRGRAKGEALVDPALIERFRGGLVGLAGGLRGPVLAAAVRSGPDAAARVAQHLAGALGPGHFFLDLQRHGDPRDEHGNRLLRDLSAGLRLPLVAATDVRYATPDRGPVLDVLQALRHKTTLDGMGRALPRTHRHHLLPPADQGRLFADEPRAVANARDLGDRLRFSLSDLGYAFPRFPAPQGETEFSLLHHLVHEGMRDRFRPVTSRVMRQITHELTLIERLDLAGYFLLVWDIARFCREQGILAQGRGSAANSAVCYALGITAVDPIAFELLFERFLSEERGEWPDIDLDLPSGDDREAVIQYVYRRYGAQSVGMTAAVITYRGRLAAREVGKAIGIDPDRVERLTRVLGHWPEYHDGDGILPRMREVGLDPADPRVASFAHVWDAVLDLPRHVSQHNGGLVIAGGRLDRVVPIEPAAMPGRAVIQWDKDDIADQRLIKVDLLGLGMLAALKTTIDLVGAHEGRTIDLAHLPPDDPTTYDMLRRADTVGVFQVESRAQMATLPRMRPERFYDLVVEVAIIRPGPIAGKMVSPYLQRRAGREPVTYDHPCLEPILKRTLGVPLFQEQLMRMAMEVGGFSGGEAEELRRAMGSRRSRAKMERLVARLREGMTANGISVEAQDRIVLSICSFALYGFPESHSASFALIAYASAWLKAHHPAAFCAALLNHWPMGFYSPATLVRDVERHGVTVLPVDVTVSTWDCSLCRGDTTSPAPRGSPDPAPPPPCLQIRLGLRYVKGLSRATADRVVAARARGPFRGVTDLGRRAEATSAELFALAECGALAAIAGGPDGRRDAMWQALALGASKDLLEGTVRENPDPAIPPMAPVELARADQQCLGLSTGPHPVAFLRSQLDRARVLPAAALPSRADGRTVRVAGMVIVRQRPGTAKGFYFATLEDETGFANIVATPDLFTANRALLSTEPFLIVEGVLQNRDGVASVRGQRFVPIRTGFDCKGRNFC